MSNAYWDQLRAEYQAAQEPALTDENGDEPVIADEPRFKVGDRVRVIDPDYQRPDDVVESLDSNGCPILANDAIKRVGWPMSMLELLDSKPVEDEGWIEWGGGDEPPVPHRTRVDVRLRDGEVYLNQDCDGCWDHGWGGADIVAYRITDMGSSTEGRADGERWVAREPKAEAHAAFDSRTRREGQAGIKPGLPANMGENDSEGLASPRRSEPDAQTAPSAARQASAHGRGMEASSVAHHFLVPPREQARLPEVSYLPQPKVHHLLAHFDTDENGNLYFQTAISIITRSLREQFSPAAFWRPQERDRD